MIRNFEVLLNFLISIITKSLEKYLKIDFNHFRLILEEKKILRFVKRGDPYENKIEKKFFFL
jgi:hypothetical protein